MKAFPTGISGAAIGRLRAGAPLIANPSSANDLVMRTLAQHGLVPVGASTAPSPQAASPFQQMMAGFRPQETTAPALALPEGARSEDQFTCPAGSRRYRSYIPASAQSGATGMIVMLHGCTQTPEDFAAGTGMNALADTHGFIVVYPHQSRGENAQSCWNWFRRGDQRRDQGEPAILAGLARAVAAEHCVPLGKTFVAGLSVGTAMAVILGETYPDVFAAVGAHSGLPCGAAKDVPSAFMAMAGNGGDPTPLAGTTPVPTIILHGTADTTVCPVNGEQIARRVLALGPRQTLQSEDRGQAGGRAYRRTVTKDSAGAPLVEHWEIEGLGHAWSGGFARGSYTDAQGPDASAAMVRFFFAAADARNPANT